MTEPNDFMRRPAPSPEPPDIPTDRPTPARTYGMSLGSKDNYEVDREMVTEALQLFPEGVDIARQNRRFLYRAVRHLAENEGIDQFLDLGSGLPTENNVHQVAQQFNPGARVVYVDDDPIVLVHGRALLAEDASTTFLQADITDPDAILGAAETRDLLDLSRPFAVLLFSIPHCIPDDTAARRAVRGCIDRAPSGSFLTLSHVVTDDPAVAEEGNAIAEGIEMPWKTRTPWEVEPWLAGLEPVAPGMGDINHWRPDPDQPPLADPHPLVAPFVGASQLSQRLYEFGGVLRTP